MDCDEKWAYLHALDDELLKGGATMSEWSAFIAKECDYAFVAGANLATIVTAVAAIETYLRAEYADGKRIRLADLVNESPIAQELRDDIHKLRRYRNTWVHVLSPEEDQAILENPESYDSELEKWAVLAQRTLRRTLYENPWV